MYRINNSPFPLIETERLQLSPLSLKDKAEIFELHSDERILKYIDRKKATEEADAIAFIEKITKGVSENKWIYWKISLKGKEELIGTICLWLFNEEKNSCDLGYELRQVAWGKGYMQEAIIPVIKHGFENVKLNKIEAFIHPENSASIHLSQKMNFVKDREEENHVVYSITR